MKSKNYKWPWLGNLHVLFLISLLFSSQLFAAGQSQVDRDHLAEQYGSLVILNTQLKKLSEILELKRNSLSIKKESLNSSISKMRDARLELEAKQKYEREYPGEISRDTILQARQKNIDATRDVDEIKKDIAALEHEITSLNIRVSAEQTRLINEYKSFNLNLDNFVELLAKIKIDKLQVPKDVIAQGVASCGDNSIQNCKERSKKEAERNATDQASVIDFSSDTIIKNNKITRDILKSEVHASLSNEKIVEQKLLNESSGFTKISVTVTPIVSYHLKKIISDEIRSDIYISLGGELPIIGNSGGISQSGIRQANKYVARVRVGYIDEIRRELGYILIKLEADVSDTDELFTIDRGGNELPINLGKRKGAIFSATLDDAGDFIQLKVGSEVYRHDQSSVQ